MTTNDPTGPLTTAEREMVMALYAMAQDIHHDGTHKLPNGKVYDLIEVERTYDSSCTNYRANWTAVFLRDPGVKNAPPIGVLLLLVYEDGAENRPPLVYRFFLHEHRALIDSITTKGGLLMVNRDDDPHHSHAVTVKVTEQQKMRAMLRQWDSISPPPTLAA